MNSKLAIIVAVIVVPLFCLALMISGVMVGYLATASTSPNLAAASSLDQAKIEVEILAIAAEYAGNQDAEAARQRLQNLGIPNEAQTFPSWLTAIFRKTQAQKQRYPKSVYAGPGPGRLHRLNGEGPGHSHFHSLATLPPTETPTPVPTDTPIPPTNTPEPTATPEPAATIERPLPRPPR
jgi:hypothetical protein